MRRSLIFLVLLIPLLIGLFLVANYFTIDRYNDLDISEGFFYVEPIIVDGNSYLWDDGYIDPLDQEILDLDNNEGETSSGVEGLCVEDLACGSEFSEEPFCIENRVYENVHSFSCDGRCSEEVEREFVEECLIGCFQGECVNTFVYDCNEDYDCGFNDFVGETYCLADDNAHQYYARFTCLNPGSLNSMCYVELVERLVEECGVSLTCEAGMCIGE